MVVTRSRATSNRASATASPTTPHSHLKSPITPPAPLSNTKPISPSQLKSIFLYEWWLVKPQGKGLAVAGLASMERERVFISTVIAKRHEANVLETEDGITIIFRGFINCSHTRQNGFPSEVCHHFLFGFPHDWKKYAAHSFGDEYVDGVAGFGDSNACSQKRADDALPFSIHVIDLTKTQELLLPNDGVLNYCSLPKKICTGLGKSLGNFSKQPESTDNIEGNNTTKSRGFEYKDNEVILKTSEPQAYRMHNSKNGVSDVAVEAQAGNPNPEGGQSLMDMKMGEEQLSSECKKKRVRQKMVEDASNSCGWMITRSMSRRLKEVTQTTTVLGKDEKVTVTCVNSPVRRSARLCNCLK